jgi:natural product precursor
MKSLKLNLLSKHEMNKVQGGANNGPCGCSCQYANNGGSSTAANRSANSGTGSHSTNQVGMWRYHEASDTWNFEWVTIVP